MINKMFFAAIAAVSLAYATDYTFQGTSGDLATPANWGATSLSSSDVGIIASGGTYTLSQNLALSQLKINTTSECVFDLRDGNHEMSLSANQHQLHIYANNRYVRLNGGVWDFGGLEFRGMGPGSQLYLQFGSIVTNVTSFYGAYYEASPGFSLYVRGNPTYGASTLYCSSFCLAGKNTKGASLYVQTGGKIVSSGSFYSDISSTSDGMMANNRIIINGEGSEIFTGGGVSFGWITSGNKMSIENGGAWHTASGRFLFGNGDKSSSSNSITVTDGTFVTAQDFLIRSNSRDNMFAATNSTVAMGSFTNKGTRTVFDLRNCAFTVGKFYPLMRAGSRVRFSGGDSVLTLANFVWRMGPFWTDVAGANPGSRLEIDDNATLAVGLGGNTQWMRTSSNCTFTVSNGAKFIAPSGGLSIGHDEALPYCHDNAIQVCSGGLLEIGGSDSGLRVHCTNNTVLVSNGTIRASTVMIGYSSSGPAASGCRLTLQGATPKVEQTGAFWLRNDSVLRFELPASGYADGYVPITAGNFVFNPTARFDIDYAAYLAAGGGRQTLVAFPGTPADNQGVSFAQWIADQNRYMNLPKGCRLMLKHDENGYRIEFLAKKPYFIVSFK